MGGEKALANIAPSPAIGSPPRGRGKEIVDITEWPTSRITPAWAGKSPAQGMQRALLWDHPRVGGEKAAFAFAS